MSNFNASTPQIKVIKNMIDAFSSLDLGKFNTLFSKDYQYEGFNGITDLAHADNATRIATSQTLLSGLTKSEVSIQQRRTVFNPTN